MFILKIIPARITRSIIITCIFMFLSVLNADIIPCHAYLKLFAIFFVFTLSSLFFLKVVLPSFFFIMNLLTAIMYIIKYETDIRNPPITSLV